MISVETLDGELVKVLHNVDHHEFGIHQLFGLISKDKAEKRNEVRKRQGFEHTRDFWHCSFEIKKAGDSWELINTKECQASRLEGQKWQLETPIGSFRLHNEIAAIPSNVTTENEFDNKLINRLAIVILILMTIVGIYLSFGQMEITEKEKEKKQEPLIVKVIQQKNTVNISRRSPSIKVKPLTKQQKAHRAVKRNLGFLGLVGSANMKKVVGGVPTKLAKATAGAGKGGDQGSGGELLVGLGKGLKKTTVGNTGVAGLGGIGTKGAGGGKGGYGNTLVASGEGKGISAISVSSRDMVLEGGLSRYAINATIAKYINQVRRCYENQLKTNPSLEGLVTIGFEIGGNGMLNYSNIIKSSLGNKKVESCITNKMMGWKFPKPKGGVNVKVDYPFMLRPVGV